MENGFQHAHEKKSVRGEVRPGAERPVPRVKEGRDGRPCASERGVDLRRSCSRSTAAACESEMRANSIQSRPAGRTGKASRPCYQRPVRRVRQASHRAACAQDWITKNATEWLLGSVSKCKRKARFRTNTWAGILDGKLRQCRKIDRGVLDVLLASGPSRAHHPS